MPTLGTHGARSSSWKPAAPGSKANHSSTETANTARLVTNPSACSARSFARGTNSPAAAPTSGKKITIESNGTPSIPALYSSPIIHHSSLPEGPVGQDAEGANQEGHGVAPHVAGLDLAERAAGVAGDAGHAVDQAVDHAEVERGEERRQAGAGGGDERQVPLERRFAVAAGEEGRDADPPPDDREDGQHHQGDQHAQRRLVRPVPMPAVGAMPPLRGVRGAGVGGASRLAGDRRGGDRLALGG